MKQISIDHLAGQLDKLGSVGKELITDSLIVGIHIGKSRMLGIESDLDKLIDKIQNLNFLIEIGVVSPNKKLELYHNYVNNNESNIITIIQNEVDLNCSVQLKRQSNSQDAYLQQLRQEEMKEKQLIEQQQIFEEQSLILAQQLQLQQEEESQYLEFMKQDQKSDLTADCTICLEQLDDTVWPLNYCGHMFHRSCLNQYFSVKIKDRQFPLQCPIQDCKLPIDYTDLLETLDQEMVNQYDQNTFNHYVDTNANEMSWCPTPDCNYAFIFEQGDHDLNCPKCQKRYCLNCRVDYHMNQTCREYQISNQFDPNDESFLEFVKGKKFKQCPQCKFWVEKNEGCDHMTCRCKYEFCYVCGGKYQQCDCGKGQNNRIHDQFLSQLQPGRRFLQQPDQILRQTRQPSLINEQPQNSTLRQLIQRIQPQRNSQFNNPQVNSPKVNSPQVQNNIPQQQFQLLQQPQLLWKKLQIRQHKGQTKQIQQPQFIEMQQRENYNIPQEQIQNQQLFNFPFQQVQGHNQQVPQNQRK